MSIPQQLTYRSHKNVKYKSFVAEVILVAVAADDSLDAGLM